MSTVVQLLGLAVALAGFYLLAGLAWTLLAGGVALLVVATLAEYTAPRAGATDEEG